MSSTARLHIRALHFLRPRPSTLCTSCGTHVPAQRHNSTATDSSPILARLRPDLKSAMKSKDTTRLNVLRAVLALITNAGKTAKPVNNDLDLVGLLRKQLKTMQTSKVEFEGAGRQDLAEKEEAQINVLQEYVGMVNVLGEEEIKSVVQEVVESIQRAGGQVNIGSIMKEVRVKLGTKPVDMRDVSRLVKEAVA